MLVKFKCPHCENNVEADQSTVGTMLPCPHCQQKLAVPEVRLGAGVTLGDFYIEDSLGEGGMGQVFLARQKSMERTVALKVLPEIKGASGREMYERFMQEIRVAARLEHPNIVTAYHAGEDEGHYFYAMSLVDGRDLADQVAGNGPLAEAEVVKVLRQVADALNYAWAAQRLLHRDIKPGNIMLDQRGDVQLLDMGIAKSLNDQSTLTMTGTMVGTPGFVSPEQARGDATLDCRSDMFSLGATAFFLLTGTAPFEGETLMQVLYKLTSTRPALVNTLNADVSDAMTSLIDTMLEKEPAHRHADWQALLDDIALVADGKMPSHVGPGQGAETLDNAATIAEPLPPQLAETHRATQDPAPARTAKMVDDAETVLESPQRPKRSKLGCALKVAAVLVMLLLVVVGLVVFAEIQRNQDIETAKNAREEALAAVVNKTPVLAVERLEMLIPQLHEDAVNEQELQRVLEGARQLTKLQETVDEARALFRAGNPRAAEATLRLAVAALPDDLRDHAEPYYKEVAEPILVARHEEDIRQRMADFITAVNTNRVADAATYIKTNSDGNPILRLRVYFRKVSGRMFGRLEDADFRVDAIEFADNLEEADVTVAIRGRQGWQALKPVRCVRDNDNWYFVISVPDHD